jgi:outer membrane cobalamin receptor
MKSYTTLSIIFTVLFLLFMSSCATTERTSDADKIEELLIENPDLELKDYLRRLSGVNVTERGGEVFVLLRGSSSISGDNSPLFVVDGTQVGTSYDSVSNAVDVKDIQSINVMRSSEAMTTFGMRASNGAILIYTR